MGVPCTVGKVAAGLGLGGLGVLGAIKLRDDRYVGGIWRTLEQSASPGEPFTEKMVADLPDPARRYFLHAIEPETPLPSRLRWGYSARIKPGKRMPWMPLTAEQIVVKERGFVWKARAGRFPLVLTAADHYLDGNGRMRISLFGLLPVVNATGPDLSKSALGRLLVESVSLPGSILPAPHVQIEGIDESRFRATVSLHGESTPITLTVDEEGRVKEMVMQRWGNQTEDGSFRYIPYGCVAEGERSFGGYTIPTQVRVGWWYGTDQYQEVIRLRVDWAEFL